MASSKRRRPTAGSDDGPPVRELSERGLCDALKAGEVWAAEEFYDRFESVVETVLFRLLGPKDGDHEDLAQQALERVITTVVEGKFSYECSLHSWTTLITQRLAIDVMRARGRDRKIFDRSVGPDEIALIAEDNQTPERAAMAQQRVAHLLSALASVSPKRAEAVALHDVWGHDLRQIAALTGVTVAAAQSRLVRGRQEILRFITQKEKDGVKL